MPKISIIGCGRLGKTIGRLLTSLPEVTILDVYNRSIEKATDSVSFIGAGKPVAKLSDLSIPDIFFITTSDGVLAQVTSELLHTINLGSARPSFVHFSGSRSSSVLEEAVKRQLPTASLHPIKSFADPEKSAHTFSGTFCALDGTDTTLKQLIASLFQALGGEVFEIDSDKKALYHTANVICCNYLVTLFQASLVCFKGAGVEEELASRILANLMSGTISNLKSIPPANALTGPLERGDEETLEKHLEALKEHCDLLGLYKTLGINTLPLTKHDEQKKTALRDMLRPRL